MSASNKINVLIIGATGTLGPHLVAGFQLPQYAPQVNLTLLVRKATAETAGPKKDALDKFVAQGAKLIYGDLVGSSEAELIVALKGQDVLISAVSVGQLGDQARLIPAAKAAGVKWLIPSEFGYDNPALSDVAKVLPLLATKEAVLAGIKEAGLDYTVIHTGAFSEFFVLPAFRIVCGIDFDTNTITAPASFDVSTVTTPLATIGLLTADAVVTGRGRNQTIKFGQTYSYGQIADLIEETTGRKFTRVVKSTKDSEAAIAANPKDFPARYQVVLGRAQGRGTVWPASETFEVKYQIACQAFPEFVKKELGGK